jgi:uncharacterized membrane protein YvbJ
MFCNNCGELIPDGSAFCLKCGKKVEKGSASTPTEETATIVYAEKEGNSDNAVIVNAEEITATKKAPWYKKKIFGGAISVVAVAFVAFIIYWSVGMANLKKQLLRDWSTVDSENGSSYILELDFSNDTIDYNFYGGILNDTIDTMEYKVISPNKIKILDYDRVITIEFNDDKTMMIASPAITSTDSIEYWFQP